MDEAALIQAAKGGDLEAFNRLVIEYQSLAFNLAFRIMSDAAAAEDATQDAFISAYRALRRFRGGAFKAWLMRIVTNACYDELRRQKRKPSTSLDLLTEERDDFLEDAESTISHGALKPEQETIRGELRQAIEHCLEKLPEDFKVVTVLVDLHGYDYQEAAKVIASPIGTVKSRLARARAQLRDCLQLNAELLPTRYRLEGGMKN